MHSVSTIGTRWRSLRGSLLDNWEIVNFLLFHLNELKPLLKKKAIKHFSLLDIDEKPGKVYKKYKLETLLGVIARIESKTLFKTILLDQVAQTEDFLQDVMRIVYRDYPAKLASLDNKNQEDPKKYQQLLHRVVTYPSKEALIEKLIDEKIRGVVYGNPLNFFLIDKVKLGCIPPSNYILI